MSITLSIDLNSIYYLPDWVCHPTLVDNFLFHSEHAEQAGKAKGWRPAQACRAGILQQRDRFARSAKEVRCSRCEAPKRYISNNNDNDANNDLKRKDNLNDGTEDTNHNGRIDGDNGDGIYGESETWSETSPNEEDTDNDGLLDSEEDKINSGTNGFLDAGETDPTEMDTDGDGLTDSQELNGWTVVITFEATGEVKERNDVVSDPRDVDSEDDGLTDYEEYTNATDPYSGDSDGDGISDLLELSGDYNSSATGIDGAPPEIWYFDVGYEGSNYEGLGPLKIPTKLEVYVTVGAKDIFGIQKIFIDITGLENKLINTDNRTNVSYKADWTISGLDKIKRVAWDGFKINVSVTDRNNNVGFKEDELPSIKDMAIDFLGPLIAIAKFIADLASGIFEWIYGLIESIFDCIIKAIDVAATFFFELIIGQIDPLIDVLLSFDANYIVSSFMSIITSFLRIVTLNLLMILVSLLIVAVQVADVIITGVSCGLTTIIATVADFALPILLSVVSSIIGGEVGELLDALISLDILKIVNILANYISTESSKGSALTDFISSITSDPFSSLSLLLSGSGLVGGIVIGTILNLKTSDKIDDKISEAERFTNNFELWEEFEILYLIFRADGIEPDACLRDARASALDKDEALGNAEKEFDNAEDMLKVFGKNVLKFIVNTFISLIGILICTWQQHKADTLKSKTMQLKVFLLKMLFSGYAIYNGAYAMFKKDPVKNPIKYLPGLLGKVLRGLNVALLIGAIVNVGIDFYILIKNCNRID